MVTISCTWSDVDKLCGFNLTSLPALLFDSLAVEQNLTFAKLLKSQMIIKKLETKPSGVIHDVSKFNTTSFK